MNALNTISTSFPCFLSCVIGCSPASPPATTPSREEPMVVDVAAPAPMPDPVPDPAPEPNSASANLDGHVCPGSLSAAEQSQEPMTRFKAAEQHLKARRWRSAAVGFRNLAFETREDIATAGAERYVATMHQLARAEPKRPQCYPQLSADIDTLHGRFCSPNKEPSSKRDLCNLLTSTGCVLDQQQATTYAEALGPLDQAPRKEARIAAERFLAIWHEFHELRPERCDLDDNLYNAGLLYIVAGDLKAAGQVEAIFADPKNNLNQERAQELSKRLRAAEKHP